MSFAMDGGAPLPLNGPDNRADRPLTDSDKQARKNEAVARRRYSRKARKFVKKRHERKIEIETVTPTEEALLRRQCQRLIDAGIIDLSNLSIHSLELRRCGWKAEDKRYKAQYRRIFDWWSHWLTPTDRKELIELSRVCGKE